jgi:hypothetical protein
LTKAQPVKTAIMARAKKRDIKRMGDLLGMRNKVYLYQEPPFCPLPQKKGPAP